MKTSHRTKCPRCGNEYISRYKDKILECPFCKGKPAEKPLDKAFKQLDEILKKDRPK